ncbi:transglycosylase SLT domain-containing protein [Streptomyces sp. NPDC056835]|uniref:transglycosylase SLT domain-containing protein n=1 Tax=Streptomyces sp. NPDC056835 TaxID=3345956 RepID=UPI0036C084E2
MASKAKHRRPKNSPVARGLVTAGTGGAVLAFPLLAATTAEAAPSAHTAATAKVTLTPAATVQTETPATYSVVWGDSLSKIADEYSLSGGWQQLYEDNRDVIGGDPCFILPGLTLTLGTGSDSQTPADSTADSSADSTGDSTADEQATSAPDESATADTGADATAAATTTYADNLDGWIQESLDVMAAHGIPGSYDGIYRNIMRESSGNPWAINNWDSNAAAGTPSKGLLQVIDPTFQAYHVPGTSTDSYDPVANITAASNYAADRYGSIDNVNGPY